MRNTDLDPELAVLSAQVPILDFADILGARRGTATAGAGTAGAGTAGVVVRDDIAGMDGCSVPVRITSPIGHRRGSLPVMLEVHGGGFALGSARSNDDSNSSFALNVPCIVVAVDYRLAPEFPFPAAVEDCITALRWTALHAESFGGDPGRVGILGTSAGACIAACTAMWARDHDGPALVMQALVEPALDDRSDSPSMEQGENAVFWNSRNARLSWELYLGGRAPDQWTTPARRTDLTGLPPTYLTVNELDPLRDQGLDFAVRLLSHDVGVELHCWPGAFHGFTMFDSALGRRAHSTDIAALRRLLGR
ncbi:hypothetical protein CH282_21035 [Rhodococcus sp. 06-418-1B]|nr:alpha/beta hydrolase [Rhodococcus sp. 06-418-1B]OZC79186.1 hypothetical protein CH282_21035 [Rhodococcus sp. 06-418-1B]